MLALDASCDAKEALFAHPRSWGSGGGGSAAAVALARERAELALRPILAALAMPLATCAGGGALPAAEAEAEAAVAAEEAAATAAGAGGGGSTAPPPPSPLAAPGVPGGHEGFAAFLAAYVLPAVAALTAALRSDLAWKPVAYALLLLTRDPRPRVRAAAVACVATVFTAGGSEALVLLPEALPFLAETRQDDDTEVEAATHALIAQLQTASGEDLSEYLTM
jgi:hypothetical protein